MTDNKYEDSKKKAGYDTFPTNFTVTQHNIGPQEYKKENIFYDKNEKDYSKLINTVFIKKERTLEYYFNTMIKNEDKSDIYLLQEVAEGDEDKDESIDIDGVSYNYKYYKTGNINRLTINKYKLEKYDINNISHGCAVVWNSEKFKESKKDIIKYTGNKRRSSDCITLSEIVNETNKIKVISLHGSIFNPINRYINIDRIEVYKFLNTILTDYSAEKIIIGTDFNYELKSFNANINSDIVIIDDMLNILIKYKNKLDIDSDQYKKIYDNHNFANFLKYLTKIRELIDSSNIYPTNLDHTGSLKQIDYILSKNLNNSSYETKRYLSKINKNIYKEVDLENFDNTNFDHSRLIYKFNW